VRVFDRAGQVSFQSISAAEQSGQQQQLKLHKKPAQELSRPIHRRRQLVQKTRAACHLSQMPAAAQTRAKLCQRRAYAQALEVNT